MTIYEILSLALSGGMLILALLTYLNDRKRK